MKIGTRTRGGWVLRYVALARPEPAGVRAARFGLVFPDPPIDRKTEHGARRQSNPGALVTPAGVVPYRHRGIEIKDRGGVKV